MAEDTIERQRDEQTVEEDDIERAVELEEKLQTAFDRLQTHEASVGDAATATVESIEGKGDEQSAEEINGFVPTSEDTVPESVQITYRAPDNTLWRTTMPFPTSQSSVMYKLFEHVDADRNYPGDLLGCEIPVVYTNDGWRVHLPGIGVNSLYRWHRWMLSHGLFTYRSDSGRDKFVLTRRLGTVLMAGYMLVMLGAAATLLTSGPAFPLGLMWVLFILPMMSDVVFKWRARGLLEAEQVTED